MTILSILYVTKLNLLCVGLRSCDLDITDIKLFDNVALYLFCLLGFGWVVKVDLVGLGEGNRTHVAL